jgi:hypothetical protein
VGNPSRDGAAGRSVKRLADLPPLLIGRAGVHESEPNAANGWSVRVISDNLRTNASKAISCRSLPIRLFSGRYQRRVLSIAGKRRVRSACGGDQT